MSTVRFEGLAPEMAVFLDTEVATVAAELQKTEEAAVAGAIVQGWKAGRVPRYVWFMRPNYSREWGTKGPNIRTIEVSMWMGSGDEPPTSAWMILPITPEAVVAALAYAHTHA